MHTDAQIEMFQDIAEQSRAEQKSPLQQLVSLVESVGACCTQRLLVKELGISKQRVSQLVKAGRFETYDIDGEIWITYRSVAEFMIKEKARGGRGLKAA